MWQSFKRRYAVFRWRRRARRKNRVPIYVTDLPRFLRRLDELQIAAAVLRWPADVPRTSHAEQTRRGDVDLLVDGSRLETVIALAAEQSGPVRCDLHTPAGHPGTTFGGMPHYPPALAHSLLEERELFDSAFPVLRPAAYFRSLAYHLAYHKGLETGIPTGCHLVSDANPKHPYAQLLQQVAVSAGETLDSPITLLSLHEHLKRLDWDIPFDLLARWPKPSDWHRWLLEHEAKALRPWAERLPHLLVFFVREDAIEQGLRDAVLHMLSEKFAILATIYLSDEQVGRVMRKVRGGDWMERRRTTLIRPLTAAVCYDFHPALSGVDQSARRTGRRRGAYPLVQNANVFFKHEIRRRLERAAKGPHRILGIHGSDNAFEAQHMLGAIYGIDTANANHRFLQSIADRSGATAGRRAA